MRSVAEYIVKHKRGNRQGNGTSKHTTQYPETEFDTNGVERDWSRNDGLDKDSTG